MGFGLLFIGYFVATLMSINIAGAFIRLLGYAIVIFAAGKLKRYNGAFTYFQIAACGMLAVSLLFAVSDVFDFLYAEMYIQTNVFPQSLDNVFNIIWLVASLIFNGFMLYAIRAIAIETEVPKIAVNAVRNAIFIAIYFVLSIIAYLPFPFTEAYAGLFGAPVLLLYFVWIVLNLVLIYSCYAKICDEDDVEMERKPSRFAFVNKMRAEFDAKEKKAMEESAEYRKEKLEKKKRRRK